MVCRKRVMKIYIKWGIKMLWDKTYKNSTRVEQEARNFVIPYYQNIYWDKFVDLYEDEQSWKDDIDFILNWKTVEMKAFTKVYWWRFLFELKKGVKGEWEWEWNFITSKADCWLIVDNTERKGWWFDLNELRMIILNAMKNNELRNLRNITTRDEIDRPKCYKKVILFDIDYILKHTNNQIIHFI